MRGYISISKDKQNDYLNCFFDAYWKDDLDLSSNENILKLLSDLNIDGGFGSIASSNFKII